MTVPDGSWGISTEFTNRRWAQPICCGRIPAIDQAQNFLSAEERLTLGRLQNPVRGLLHGSAALLSTGGLIFLVGIAKQTEYIWSLSIYGLALVAMYATSSIYHAVSWRPHWKVRLQRLDHITIYLLVAGTTTPLMVSTLAGPLEWLGLVLIWAMAAVGAVREVPRLRKRWSLIFQMLLGGTAVFPLLETLSRISPMAVFLVVAGGVVYLGGVTMFINSWPRLLPRVFSYHELFHVLVVVASVAHFVAVREVILSTQ